MTPKVLYINLDARPDRRDFMERQLTDAGVDYARFPAVRPNHESLVRKDGEHHTYFKRARRSVRGAARDRESFQPFIGMFGCYISHYLVHDMMANEGERDYIVLEDDCIFTRSNFDRLVHRIESREIPENWDIVRNCLKSNQAVQGFERSHRFSLHSGLRNFHDHYGGTFFCMFRGRSRDKIIRLLNTDNVFAIDAVYSTHMLNSYHTDLGFHHTEQGSDIVKTPMSPTSLSRTAVHLRAKTERAVTKLVKTRTLRASDRLT